MPIKKTLNRIIISRTDAIGDVILTFPMCGIIKKYYPDSEILFLGRTYTSSVINCCEHIDKFINADEILKLNKNEAIEQLKNLEADTIIHVFPNKKIASLAKQAKIKTRIGTTNRLFHWGTVNKMIHLSRKNSDLHEAQLNCKLLSALGINDTPQLDEMVPLVGFTRLPLSDNAVTKKLRNNKINIILHPKSNVSAREWSLNNFESLIQLLPSEKYMFFISGTAKEQALLTDWIKSLPENVIDITGKLSLDEFISFISKADYLIAASTGPLHIAASVGIRAIGIYPPIRPMHPGRWQPLGNKVRAVSVNKSCNDCRKFPLQCHCINEITPLQIASIIKTDENR